MSLDEKVKHFRERLNSGAYDALGRGRLAEVLTSEVKLLYSRRIEKMSDQKEQTGEEGSTLSGGVIGSDPDGDPVDCYLVSSTLPELKVSPGCGIYSDAPLPAAPEVNYNVVVGITDGVMDDTASLDFEVQRPPTVPSSGGNSYGVFEQQLSPLTFTLTSTDPNGDPITYNSTALPAGATLNQTTGVFQWNPSCTQGSVAGTIYTVGFTAKDDKNLESGLDTVVITVFDNCPP